MILRSLLTLAMLGLAAAESSVVSLFIFDADPQPLVGSIVATTAGTTTYSINCPAGVDAQDCGVLPGLLYTTAPSSVEWHLKPPYDRYGTVYCSMGGTTSAACTEHMPQSGSLSRPGRISTMTGTEVSSMPVTITAGPGAAPTASNTGASATSTGGSGSGSSEGSGQGSTASQTSGSTSSSTGGMARNTAGPGVVLGGAAAVLAAAVAL